MYALLSEFLGGTQGHIGLGARADLRSCSEWYYRKKRNTAESAYKEKRENSSGITSDHKEKHASRHDKNAGQGLGNGSGTASGVPNRFKGTHQISRLRAFLALAFLPEKGQQKAPDLSGAIA